MKKLIEHNVNGKIKKESPEICLEVIYQDDFSDDHYILRGLSENGDSKLLKFEVTKNGQEVTFIEMKERNVNEFLNEFLEHTKDADFNEEFKSKIYDTSSKQITDFFEFYDNSVVTKGLNLEGEIKRMKKMAGIIKS